jgi:N-acetylglucosamine kinase-like BadF-type ATPase
LSRLYLGVDGGQSSTTALIADENGSVLGVGRGGPCNHVNEPQAREKFRKVIGHCLAEAAAGAGLSFDRSVHFASACLGFSGGGEDKLAYCRELISSSRLKVTNDAEIALVGATAGEPGIVVIAGTGSITFGRNASGRIARAGGWGHIFGDEGGAFDIVRRALRAALQAEEGWGPSTSLRALLLEKTKAHDANQLLHFFYQAEKRYEVAPLAPLVTAAAESGDPVAQEILAESARLLVWYAEGVYRNLFSNSERVPIAYIGGVFQSAPLRSAFIERVHEQLACEAVPPLMSPVAGALLEALRLDGNPSRPVAIPKTKT